MKKHGKNRIPVRLTACALAAGMLMTNTAGLASYAATAYSGADVDEKLYINMDYYGGVEKANVVKEVQFSTAGSYTDYGNYTGITNMTDRQEPAVDGDAVTWMKPEKGNKLYFQGNLDPANVKMPWDFQVTYKVNGIVTAPEEVGGASGTVEIDVDAVPNKSVSKYMQDNMILLVLIPMDTANVYSIDAPESMSASFGNYSGIGFEALPGKEGHFTARFGTDSFESMGVMMIMTPVTVSDMAKIKDLKELKDKFRDNSDAVLDSVEAIMDNVADMSSQLEKTNQVLDEIASGKRKLDAGRTIIFNGVDLSLQDVRDLNALLDPVDTSLKTSQWMVYDINSNLNATNAALNKASGVMGTLNKRLRVLSEEMATTNTYKIDSVAADLDTAKKALTDLKKNLVTSGTAVSNLKTITDSAAYEKAVNELLYTAALDSSEYGEDYLPEAVIEIINASIPDITAVTKEQLQGMMPTVASLLDIYRVLATPKKGVTEADTYTVTATATPSDMGGGSDVTGSVTASAGNTYELKVSAADLNQVAAGLAAYKQSGDPTAAVTAISSYLAGNGFSAEEIAGYRMSMLGRLGAGTSAGSAEKASRFINRMISMLDLKSGIDTLETNTKFSTAGSSLKNSMGELREAGTEALANAITAYSSFDYDQILTQTDRALKDIDDVMNAGATVSYQTSRLLDSLRKVTASVDALTTTMNAYYEDVQTALTNVSNVIEQTEKLAADLTGTAQTLNNTLRAASEDLSRAADDSIDLGREAVDNADKMVENTRKMKEAGAELRKSINDELDEQEADNNFLNMDPDATKESLTSSRNQEPSNIQIICRTEEITADGRDQDNGNGDAEIPQEQTTLGGRVVNIFKAMWSKVTGIFGIFGS